MRRKIISAVLAASVLLGAMAFSGCQNKNHGKVEKVSKDSDWFDLTTIELGEKYKDMDLFMCDSQIIGLYNDGVLIQVSGIYKPFWEIDGTTQSVADNEFTYLDYYDTNGNLIKSIDIGKSVSVMDNRQIEDVIIVGDGVKLNIIQYGNGKNTFFWADVDMETGNIGEPEEIVYDKNDIPSADDLFFIQNWTSGDYVISVNSRDILRISKDGKNKLVDLNAALPFTNFFYFSGCITVSENEILLTILSNDIKFLYLNLETGEAKNKDEEYSWMNSISYTTQTACFDGKNYIMDQEGIKQINFESKELEEVLSFNCCNLNKYETSKMKILSVDDDKFVLSGTQVYDADRDTNSENTNTVSISVLEKAETNPNAGKIIIKADTLGQTLVDYSVCEAIKVFNDTNDQYFIQFEISYNIADYIDYSNAEDNDEIKNIYYNGASVLGDQAASDMIAGEGPDIILYANRFGQFLSEDYLVDLNSYIEGKSGINRSDYFSNVFDAAEIDGKLFYMPLDFEVEGIFTQKSNVRDGQIGFTYDEYVEFVDKVCNGSDPMNDTKLGVVCTLYSYMNDKCINGKEVNFDNEYFRALCEYVKENVVDYQDEVYGQTELGYFRDFEDVLRNYGNSFSSGTLLGLPSIDGSGPYIYVDTAIGISAFAPSVVADGAWEFIKTCLSDVIQEQVVGYEEMNPMSISTYDSTAVKMLERYKKNDPSYSVLKPLDDSVIDTYKDTLLSASVIEFSDPAVFCVIREELQPYFMDQKSLDDVLKIINNRVSVIVAER